MLESFNVNTEMRYQKLTPEEQQERGILGRLVGVIADFKNPTRNGRRYTEELWDKTFSNPLMQEKFENRCLFGELGHPVDRQEIDMEKIAICLAEVPKKGNDGKLYGVFDILATPNGRILKTMCDYGCKIGVSSRGAGETSEAFDGTESVDPDSFECECWDAVLLPAVKEARPLYVTESLNSRTTLKQALQEALNNSSENDKKVMEQTLNELNISDYTEENTRSKSDNINTVTEGSEVAADDNGAKLVQELQTSLKEQQRLEAQIEALQKQVSVCYTKESRYDETLSKTKQQLKDANKVIEELKDELAKERAKVKEDEKILESLKLKNSALINKLDLTQGRHSVLSESLKGKDKTITSLKEEFKSVQEALILEKETLSKENKKLSEEIEELNKDSQIVKSQSLTKVKHAEALVEKYKAVARTAVDKYINLQAKRLGVNSSQIKEKLKENYSFNDIDQVCESLQQYKLTMNSLPFNLNNKNQKVRLTVKESVQTNSHNNSDRIDDDIDSTLSQFI